jgi:hypothetical protein
LGKPANIRNKLQPRPAGDLAAPVAQNICVRPRGGAAMLRAVGGHFVEVVAMCDYSLHNVATRPAQVGDTIVTGQFPNCITRGFAAVEEPNVAVCLRPGTEIAFDHDIEFEGGRGFFRTWSREARLGVRVARFRQIDVDKPHVHHDALELPSGEIVLVTRLIEGQRATVLQLPAAQAGSAQEHGSDRPTAERLVEA